MDDFEQRLSHEPLRKVPVAWRDEILSAARAAQPSPEPTPLPWFSSLPARLAAMLWPHPAAWGALAAIWIIVLAVNASDRPATAMTAKKSTATSPQIIAELKQQRLWLAELVGANRPDADRARVFVPQPRSERMQGFSS